MGQPKTYYSVVLFICDVLSTVGTRLLSSIRVDHVVKVFQMRVMWEWSKSVHAVHICHIIKVVQKGQIQSVLFSILMIPSFGLVTSRTRLVCLLLLVFVSTI